jgi:hypothetical protein
LFQDLTNRAEFTQKALFLHASHVHRSVASFQR